MNKIEQYEFDRLGYIVIPNLLTEEEVKTLSATIDALEEDALAQLDRPPDKISAYGLEYRHNPDKGYYVNGAKGEGNALLIDEFFNFDRAFDVLVDHAPTMAYIRAIVQERPTINNSELRIRYPGNQTASHCGGPVGLKLRYYFQCARKQLHDGENDLLCARCRPGPGRVLRRARHAQEQYDIALRRRKSRHGTGHDRAVGQGRRRHLVHREPAPRRLDQPFSTDAEDAACRLTDPSG